MAAGEHAQSVAEIDGFAEAGGEEASGAAKADRDAVGIQEFGAGSLQDRAATLAHVDRTCPGPRRGALPRRQPAIRPRRAAHRATGGGR